MSYQKIVDGHHTKKEAEEHETKWGRFNFAPPGFKEITDEEFAQSGFFTWCKVGMEFRQLLPENIDQSKMLSPVTQMLTVTMFYMNHGANFAIANDYWGKKVRYFMFADCYHEYVELSKEESEKRGHRHFGNCYHVELCKKCGYVWAYDSSG